MRDCARFMLPLSDFFWNSALLYNDTVAVFRIELARLGSVTRNGVLPGR